MNLKTFLRLTERRAELDPTTHSGQVDYVPTAEYSAMVDAAVKRAVERSASRARRLHLLFSTLLIEVLVTAIISLAAY
ncbi:MAG TPA: hypothetical protein VG826_33085 [Pirellulales bacterium]|nr:hypothetical protein [Pirellulales bacterium]